MYYLRWPAPIGIFHSQLVQSDQLSWHWGLPAWPLHPQ